MTGIITCIGSLISGIREKLANVDNIELDTIKIDIRPKIQQFINEAGEIEDKKDTIESLSAVATPVCLEFGNSLSRLNKPIDIILCNSSIEREKQISSALSSRQHVKAQKLAEKDKISEKDAGTSCRYSSFSEWMEKRRFITVYRGIIPEIIQNKYDWHYLCVRKKIKDIFKRELIDEKGMRFPLYFISTLEYILNDKVVDICQNSGIT